MEKFIYHGTTESNWRKISQEGLVPRGDRKSNWTHTVESAKDRVYLSSAYAPYFAMAAAENGEGYVVVQVDFESLDQEFLLPDEDFLEQAMREEISAIIGSTMKQRTEYMRDHARSLQSYWRASLETMGVVAYQGKIKLSEIESAYLIEPKKLHPAIHCMIGDPTITVLNYYLMERKYKALTAFLTEKDYEILDFLEPLGGKFTYPVHDLDADKRKAALFAFLEESRPAVSKIF